MLLVLLLCTLQHIAINLDESLYVRCSYLPSRSAAMKEVGSLLGTCIIEDLRSDRFRALSGVGFQQCSKPTAIVTAMAALGTTLTGPASIDPQIRPQ